MNTEIRLSKNKFTEKFLQACREGNLEEIRCLLTLPIFKEHRGVKANNDVGFQLACANGHFNLVEYLLISPEVKYRANIHDDRDYGFRMATALNHMKIVQFLIFEINIEKTKDIQDFLTEFPKEQVENMFKLRELNKYLQSELKYDKISHKKLKV